MRLAKHSGPTEDLDTADSTAQLSILTPILPFVVGRYHRTPSPLPQNAHKKPMSSSPAVSLISLVSVPYISIETDRGVPAA